jgi:hypothetical protein
VKRVLISRGEEVRGVVSLGIDLNLDPDGHHVLRLLPNPIVPLASGTAPPTPDRAALLIKIIPHKCLLLISFG